MERIDTCAALSFGSYAELAHYHKNKRSEQRYARDSSSAVMEVERTFERRYEDADGAGYRALLFNSGMSAINAVLDTLMDDQRMLFVPNEYYRKLLDLTGANWKSCHQYENLREVFALVSQETARPSLVWIESPSNPHLRLADYETLLKIRKEPGVLIVGDLTLSGLNNFIRPQDIFDVELHSCAKYASGHNDIMAGVAMVREDLYAPLWERRSFAGGILDPFSAYLLGRSLATYDIRLAAQTKSAFEIVSWLDCEYQHDRIFYPGKYEGQVLQSKFHRHQGSVVSILCGRSSLEEMTDICGAMKHFRMAPNFGSVESQIEVVRTMSFFGKSDEECRARGIENDLIRFSVGLEHPSLLIDDLRKIMCYTT